MTEEEREATRAVTLAALNAGVSPEQVVLAFRFNDRVDFIPVAQGKRVVN